MTIKPFAIQGADLTLGGVNLSAGATTIVIPGVTQAVNYFVEEVNDTDVDQTNTLNLPIIIDNVTHVAKVADAGASVAAYATYTVELDDEDYVDEIEVNTAGTYVGSEVDRNADFDMWGYTGSDAEGYLTNWVTGDWVQIPFRPKMRAGEVENIGGSGSADKLVNGSFEVVLDENGNLTLPNDIKAGVTGGRFIQDCDDGTTSMRWINMNQGSNSAQLIRAYTGDPDQDNEVERAQIKLNWDETEDLSGLTIRTFDDSDNSTNHNWLFKGDGVLQLPVGGDIVDSNGVSVLGGGVADNNIWVETFTSDAQTIDFVQAATGVEYDADGNVFALFSHVVPTDNNSTYTSVAKLTPAGAVLWQVRFSVDLNSDGWGLAYDGSDSVYVAGKTSGTPLTYEFATLTKIDAISGTIVWSKTYDFEANSQSAVVDVDSDLNPIMVGYADNGTDRLIITTKVDQADGLVIWSKTLDGQGDEEAYGMAVGPTGEVVTIGYADQLGPTDGAATVYTDPVSNVNWVNSANISSGNFSCDVTFADGVPTFTNIVDPTGNRTVDGIIATVSVASFVGSGGSGAEFDITNNGDGTYTLNSITNGGTNYLAGHKIKVLGSVLGGVDVTNDVIITVTAVTSGVIDTASISGVAASSGSASGKSFSETSSPPSFDGTNTISFSGPRSQMLSAAWASFNVGDDISFVVSGTTYTSTISQKTGLNDFMNPIPFTLVVTSGGGAPSGTVTLFTVGNLSGLAEKSYTTGPSVSMAGGPNPYDRLLISDPISDANLAAYIASIPSGATITAYTPMFGSSVFTLTSAFTLDSGSWAATFTRDSGSDSSFIGMTVTTTAGGPSIIYNNLTGTYYTDGTDDMILKVATVAANDVDDRMVVIKYAADGTIAWQKAVQFDAGYDCLGADADIDATGNIYVCGQYQYDYNSYTTSAMSLVKFNSSGVKQWSRRVVGDCDTFATSVVVGPDNNLYLSGVTANNNASDYIWVVAKYDTDGVVVWQRLIDNTTTWTFGGTFWFGGGGGSNIAVGNGYVALAGAFGDPGVQPKATIVQIDTDATEFSVGDWDIKAATFSGVLNVTASDIVVVDAGKTAGTAAPTAADFATSSDSSNFLSATRAGAASGNSIDSGAYSVSVGSNGVVTMATSRGSLEFGALPEIGGQSHFHIMKTAGDNADLFLGDDFNYVLQRGPAYGASPGYGVEIGTNDNDGGAQHVWRFGTNGQMTFPQDTVLSEFVSGPTNTFGIFANAVPGRSVTIRTSPGGPNKDWIFGSDGSLSLPGAVVNSTEAKTGVVLPTTTGIPDALSGTMTGLTTAGTYGPFTRGGVTFSVTVATASNNYTFIGSNGDWAYANFAGTEPPTQIDFGDTPGALHDLLTAGGVPVGTELTVFAMGDGVVVTTGEFTLTGGVWTASVSVVSGSPFGSIGQVEFSVVSTGISGFIDISSTTPYAVNASPGTLTSEDLGDPPGQTTNIDVISVVQETPTALDLTKSINKLTSGRYTLADGVEGQIMYLVPQDGITSAANVGVSVANFRMADFTGTGGSLLPFRIYNGVDLMDSTGICTLIFTDNAWQQTGGAWD